MSTSYDNSGSKVNMESGSDHPHQPAAPVFVSTSGGGGIDQQTKLYIVFGLLALIAIVIIVFMLKDKLFKLGEDGNRTVRDLSKDIKDGWSPNAPLTDLNARVTDTVQFNRAKRCEEYNRYAQHSELQQEMALNFAERGISDFFAGANEDAGAQFILKNNEGGYTLVDTRGFNLELSDFTEVMRTINNETTQRLKESEAAYEAMLSDAMATCMIWIGEWASNSLVIDDVRFERIYKIYMSQQNSINEVYANIKAALLAAYDNVDSLPTTCNQVALKDIVSTSDMINSTMQISQTSKFKSGVLRTRSEDSFEISIDNYSRKDRTVVPTVNCTNYTIDQTAAVYAAMSNQQLTVDLYSSINRLTNPNSYIAFIRAAILG